MLEKTRGETTGIELKVNESILDSCTSLMHVSQLNLGIKQEPMCVYRFMHYCHNELDCDAP